MNKKRERGVKKKGEGGSETGDTRFSGVLRRTGAAG